MPKEIFFSSYAYNKYLEYFLQTQNSTVACNDDSCEHNSHNTSYTQYKYNLIPYAEIICTKYQFEGGVNLDTIYTFFLVDGVDMIHVSTQQHHNRGDVPPDFDLWLSVDELLCKTFNHDLHKAMLAAIAGEPYQGKFITPEA